MGSDLLGPDRTLFGGPNRARRYYANASTGESSWEIPAELRAAQTEQTVRAHRAMLGKAPPPQETRSTTPLRKAPALP